MKTTVLNTLFVALSLTAATAQADWRPGSDRHEYGAAYSAARQNQGMNLRDIEERLDRQMQRIQRGRESGQLTRWEFRSLMRDHHSVRAMQRDFMADGHLSRFEFRELDRALDAAGQRIRFEKQDGEARNSYFDYHAAYR